ncbi:MAG: AzlD domain-containing protein, partial [Anaerolineae bacterium]|nr:AzlD domain-containing protein [Anaerolineae bacterium]
ERLPQAMQRSLTYVAPAVLAALVLPELVLTSGDFHLSAFNSRLVAGALAAVVGWRSRNTWLTIASGMIALWLLSAL